MTRTMLFSIWSAISFLPFALAAGGEAEIVLHVAAPEADCAYVPLHASIDLPGALKGIPVSEIEVALREKGGETAVRGEVRPIDGGGATLWWVAPLLKKGVPGRWTATLRKGTGQDGFVWAKTADDCIDLLLDGKKVVRYQYAFDRSTPERLHETYKPFHHVFDGSGENLLTKGPGGLYTHHRGIFIGWNKFTFKDKQHDLWHMPKGFQRHERFLGLHAGPVMAGQKLLIHWVDGNGTTVVEEEREIVIFRQPPPAVVLIEFRTRLKAVAGDIFLDGDPEHGGFQFRAHNGVAEGGKDVKAAYLFHRDGVDAHKDTNLPWVAMTFGPAGGKYTVQHMNHSLNPQPSVYSAYRDYGRFGAFFKAGISANETLDLSYRIHVARGGDPKREEMAGRHALFANAVEVRAASE